MKAYFTASIAGKKDFLNNYEQIVNLLQAKSVEVLADHILNKEKSQIHMETKTERLQFQKKLVKWISGSDFLVAETTFPSISVGYEISMAVTMHKPVLLLYSEGDPPSLLGGNTDERIICENYANDTLDEIVEYFLYYVKDSNDTRFTFYITSAIARYLDAISKKARIPKSVYLRHLIEMDMKHNQYNG